jgi:diaminohydroxyphosphoribosylaminopyrimidine deaminase/5-amino-6-(5-phosphoribosylamino)uracil reductase
VYAVSDPGAASSGGAARLAEAGVAVAGGLLADEAEEFQHVWLTAMREQRPYVTAKWGSSLDGRIAAADGSSQWITGEAARIDVHQRRAAADVVLVGTGTVLADDPGLTARAGDGTLLPHQPRPVVVGRRALPVAARLRQHPAGVAQLEGEPAEVLAQLWSEDVRHVFIEGGPTVTSAFIATGLVDEYLVYLAPVLLGGPKTATADLGVASITDAVRLTPHAVHRLGDDVLVIARTKEN